MIEKVNPSHPDKLADRIAGAIVDLCYDKNPNPRVAVEVLLGHGECNIIMESSFDNAQLILSEEINNIVKRIADINNINLKCYKQDEHLARNSGWGDNGIFKGEPLTREEELISIVAKNIYAGNHHDGKYILDKDKLIVCQSHCENREIEKVVDGFPEIQWLKINPIGYWTGGPNIDSGATNRKLGSDMGHSVTGGGLHGKDLSKADVSINIYAWLKAQEIGKPVELFCAIGDQYVDGKTKTEIIEIARNYIKKRGGFEKFAEWGLF